MHGLGNDFIMLNQQDLPKDYDLSNLAIAICNRRTAIGCDQLIIYDKEESNCYSMTIYNQDGSLAKMCGNAARCLAKLLCLKHEQQQITLKLADRKIACQILDNDKISVNMGKPSFSAPWMPSADKIWSLAERYQIEPKEIICVDMGNPHLVIFSLLSEHDKELIGGKLQNSPLFPDGVNVNFASIQDSKIHLLVWERGTGFTLACGSGACASFVAAVKLGFISSPATIIFKHGSLLMQQLDEDIIMQGPASLVATGEFFYE